MILDWQNTVGYVGSVWTFTVVAAAVIPSSFGYARIGQCYVPGPKIGAAYVPGPRIGKAGPP